MSKLGVVVVAAMIGCGGAQTAPGSPDASATDALIKAFWQGPEGNCTSIAFVKAVIDKFHTAQAAFPHYADDGATIVASQATGPQLTVTHAEVETVALALKIQHVDGPVYEQAKIVFGLLARACQLDCTGAKTWCAPSADRACDSLDSAAAYLNGGLLWNGPPALVGMQAGTDYRELGGSWLSKWIHVVKFVDHGGACVAATPYHTYFAANGRYDHYGTPFNFTHTSSRKGLEAKNAYCLGASELQVVVSDDQDDNSHRLDEMQP